MRIQPAPLVLLLLSAALTACAGLNQAGTDDPLVQRAESGDAASQHKLGLRHADAAFPRTGEAIYWLCEASKQGHVGAQLALARLYQGRVRVSVTENSLSSDGSAYFWYTAAAAQGNGDAFDSREQLATRMSEDEIIDVKRRATRWRRAVCVRP